MLGAAHVCASRRKTRANSRYWTVSIASRECRGPLATQTRPFIDNDFEQGSAPAAGRRRDHR
ncbi:hypothetical protein C5688_20215 [Methylocystis sp. MitZ-2018]|nr:hypothetical protein C5688_20215 [Methylocystis sp. MitZ-2018]